MTPKYSIILIAFFLLSITMPSHADDPAPKPSATYGAPEARQAVATDSAYFYAVGNQEIGKYDRKSGKRVASWVAPENSGIHHLNSAVVVNGKLYCANSNYPDVPMTGSIEIWDTTTLTHMNTFSFGIVGGSLTWIDHFDGKWWAGFGMYSDSRAEPGKDPAWTQVVLLNENWQRLQGWIFPKSVVDRFRPMTNSGASWGPDDLLYCTGHDQYEVYAMRLPKTGSTLEFVKTIPVANFGQGIAWDRAGQSNTLWGIIKSDRQVVVTSVDLTDR